MRALIAISSFAERRPLTYLSACALLGLVLRLWMAGGDLGKFVDPLYPLLHR